MGERRERKRRRRLCCSPARARCGKYRALGRHARLRLRAVGDAALGELLLLSRASAAPLSPTDEGLGEGRAVETLGRLVEVLALSEGQRRRPVAARHGCTARERRQAFGGQSVWMQMRSSRDEQIAADRAALFLLSEFSADEIQP